MCKVLYNAMIVVGNISETVVMVGHILVIGLCTGLRMMLAGALADAAPAAGDVGAA